MTVVAHPQAMCAAAAAAALHEWIWEAAGLTFATHQPQSIAHCNDSLAIVSPYAESALWYACHEVQNSCNTVAKMHPKWHPGRHLQHRTMLHIAMVFAKICR